MLAHGRLKLLYHRDLIQWETAPFLRINTLEISNKLRTAARTHRHVLLLVLLPERDTATGGTRAVDNVGHLVDSLLKQKSVESLKDFTAHQLLNEIQRERCVARSTRALYLCHLSAAYLCRDMLRETFTAVCVSARLEPAAFTSGETRETNLAVEITLCKLSLSLFFVVV